MIKRFCDVCNSVIRSFKPPATLTYINYDVSSGDVDLCEECLKRVKELFETIKKENEND